MSSNKEISDRLNDFLRDDQENLTAINEIISRFGGGSSPPREIIQQMSRLMDGNELTLDQKASAVETAR